MGSAMRGAGTMSDEEKARRILCLHMDDKLTDTGTRLVLSITRALAYERAEAEPPARMLERAAKIIWEGKARLTPHTTNSFVDDWLADYADYRAASERPRPACHTKCGWKSCDGVQCWEREE